jgi:hypothetical protein
MRFKQGHLPSLGAWCDQTRWFADICVVLDREEAARVERAQGG